MPLFLEIMTLEFGCSAREVFLRPAPFLLVSLRQIFENGANFDFRPSRINSFAKK